MVFKIKMKRWIFWIEEFFWVCLVEYWVEVMNVVLKHEDSLYY
jgi:hypothetical protein